MSELRALLLPRLSFAASLLWSLVSQMVWWASPAEAQGFFQQLFGLSSSQVQTAPRASPLRPLGGQPMRIVPSPGTASWAIPQPSRAASNFDSKPGKEGSGGYTTVCVRLCDGFYFPISHKAPRSRFYRDADVCRSKCSESDSQLFYYSSNGGDMRSAVDLTGRAYARQPYAFVHRAKRVQGCGCRPEPWSVAALARHEGYAMAEGLITVAGHRPQGTLTIVAGSYPEPTPAAAEADQGNASHAAAASAADGEEQASVPTPDAQGAALATGLGIAEDNPPKSVALPSRQPQAAGARQASRTDLKPARQANRLPASSARSAVAVAPRKPAQMAAAAPAPKLLWPGDAPVRTR